MKFTVTAWAVALLTNGLMEHLGRGMPSVAVFVFYMVIEAMLREIAFEQRVKWCKTPAVKEWVRTEFTITLQSFAFGCTVIGCIIFLLFAENTYDAVLIVAAILSLNYYARSYTPKTLGVPNIEKFRPLKDSQINGDQYRLPPWWLLRKDLRRQLWEESHKKVPALGETHLFVYKGATETVVRIFAPGRRTHDAEEISSELRSRLESFPKTAAKRLIEDPVPLIRQF